LCVLLLKRYTGHSGQKDVRAYGRWAQYSFTFFVFCEIRQLAAIHARDARPFNILVSARGFYG
jgi:hypothetical protein